MIDKKFIYTRKRATTLTVLHSCLLCFFFGVCGYILYRILSIPDGRRRNFPQFQPRNEACGVDDVLIMDTPTTPQASPTCSVTTLFPTGIQSTRKNPTTSSIMQQIKILFGNGFVQH